MRYLRRLREQKGLSQHKLAEQAGLTQDSVSRIETGERKPRHSTLEKLARVLEVEDPNALVLPLAPVRTFEEVIEGTPEERRDYIEELDSAGRLPSFIKNLEEIYAESAEDYRDNPRAWSRVQAAYMLGCLRTMREKSVSKGEEL